MRITCAAISWLTRGRFTDSHDELLYVIRKPHGPVRPRRLTARAAQTRDTEAHVTAELPAELADWPAWTPGEEQLGELELLTSGAFAPLTGYLTAADLAAVAARGELADGTPWPIPVTLTVPASAVPADAGHLVLQDPEGSPLAVIEITERTPPIDRTAPRSGWRARSPRCARPSTGRSARCGGRPPTCGPSSAAWPVLALATRRPLGQRQLGQLRHLADQLRARILLLPLVAGPAELVVRPEALVRAVRAAARQLPDGTLVVPVPLPPQGRPGRRAARPGPSSRPPTGRPTCWQTRTGDGEPRDVRATGF